MNILNTDRREIEAAVRAEALAQVEARGDGGALAWAAGDGWHPGVVGIVAARVKEATGRPAVVIGFDGTVGKGSARSVEGVDLGASVHQLASEGLIEKGGGHRMAAGLSLARAQLEPAMARLAVLLARQGDLLPVTDLRLDGVLMASAVTPELVELLETAGPFGAAAPAPRFAIADQQVFTRRMGDHHMRVHFGDGAKLEAVLFNAFDTPLGAALEQAGHRRFHLAGRLEINTWGGRSKVQLRLEDAAYAVG